MWLSTSQDELSFYDIFKKLWLTDIALFKGQNYVGVDGVDTTWNMYSLIVDCLVWNVALKTYTSNKMILDYEYLKRSDTGISLAVEKS